MSGCPGEGGGIQRSGPHAADQVQRSAAENRAGGGVDELHGAGRPMFAVARRRHSHYRGQRHTLIGSGGVGEGRESGHVGRLVHDLRQGRRAALAEAAVGLELGDDAVRPTDRLLSVVLNVPLLAGSGLPMALPLHRVGTVPLAGTVPG